MIAKEKKAPSARTGPNDGPISAKTAKTARTGPFLDKVLAVGTDYQPAGSRFLLQAVPPCINFRGLAPETTVRKPVP